ncbi:MFS transporter [Kitasatospora sp. MMS16-BH015]|uniref:MFS transporter n=1 Tax=Kitasatospora sp. MMS16-BH015 TaxID=2018025 RepID=UPI000CA3D146|nr:MFS transporter [Kitasatospora sp. MMS16-BH015]AUG78488.1 MFS transporter [Kitasatospora sp. MMS16-BH015]
MTVDPASPARAASVPGPRPPQGSSAAPAAPASPVLAVETGPPGGRSAWAAWSIAVSVYVLAVMHRTSLGVAGLDAAQRFGINASALATFSILQVLVYAAMQIPVGLLVDRFGPKRVLLTGVLLLSAGQLAFALSPGFGPALVSRAVLGCGDAMTFISVLRVVARWFPAGRNALVAQLTGLVGTGGNLITTVVIAQALHAQGWTPTFGTMAGIGLLVFAVVALLLREAPAGAPAPAPAAPRRLPVRQQVRDAWREPGTRLGMAVHFTTAFPGAAFSLLWGLPYLVEGQGVTRAEAGGLLTLLVLANMAFGLVFGRMLMRSARARMPITLAVIATTTAGWTLALAWPGAHPPLWLLVLILLVMGSNGPASLVGLDYARSHNPLERLGTATGIANMGGFIGTVITLLGVGVLLDTLSGPGGYTAETYRWAFCWMLLPMAGGVIAILRLRGKVGRP